MTNNDISIHNQVERIERFQSLQAGRYWRATQDIPNEGIKEGEVLLVESIRYADGIAHTFIVRAHPDKFGRTITVDIPQDNGTVKQHRVQCGQHKFLLADFLGSFEFEPGHQQIRSGELLVVQERINQIQMELLEAQTNPALFAGVVEEKLREREIPKDTVESGGIEQLPVRISLAPVSNIASLAEVVGSGITEAKIANLKDVVAREQQIASIKSDWLQKKTGEIAEAINAMTPYYQEQAAAALAQTEDTRTHVEKLLDGIKSLDLYVGKDVSVETLRTGESAPDNEPLTFVQKKMLMDEELALHLDIDEGFDAVNQHRFFEELSKNNNLVEQVFPAPRCVLVMATTRRYINYGDGLLDMRMNAANHAVFLLVRNGMNIHRVISPVESHLGTARLFPSKDDQKRVFRGVNGFEVNFDDVAYTDKLASYEKFAVHYKRFLILMAGLDHRLKLFGRFYDEADSLNFVSMEFQDKHCRFIHDDDGSGMLPGENRPSVRKWIASKNAFLRSGSRVLCLWRSLLTHDTAPSAFRSGAYAGEYVQAYYPKNPMDVAIAYQSGDGLYVDVELRGQDRRYLSRCFTAKVLILPGRSGEQYQLKRDSDTESPELEFLCLDAVSPEDMDWYLHHRGSRENHLLYIRFFRMALKYVRLELDAESETRRRMAQALFDGGIASGKGADALIQKTVMACRSANRGKPLPLFDGSEPPEEWRSLLDQMYALADGGARHRSNVIEFAKTKGYSPSRLVLSGNAKLVLYAAPAENERDDRLVPHCWVHKILLETGKQGIKEKSRSWALLPESVGAETTLYEWQDAADSWRKLGSVFRSFNEKQQILGITEAFAETLTYFLKPMDTSSSEATLARWWDVQQKLLAKEKWVRNPELAIPFGVIYYSAYNKLHFLCVGYKDLASLLYKCFDEGYRERLRKLFVGCYASHSNGERIFAKHIDDSSGFKLIKVEVKTKHNAILTGDECLATGRDYGDLSSVDQLFFNWQALNPLANFWMPSCYLDESGSSRFDQIFGLSARENSNPVMLFEFRAKDGIRSDRRHWFDICPIDYRPPAEDFDDNLSVIGVIMASVEKARSHIENSDFRGTFVMASDLPSISEAPQGIERWCKKLS